jgi:hypothetical protein
MTLDYLFLILSVAVIYECAVPVNWLKSKLISLLQSFESLIACTQCAIFWIGIPLWLIHKEIPQVLVVSIEATAIVMVIGIIARKLRI